MTPEVFQQVALALSGRVYTYAAWMVRDLEEARDVTQESFLRLWANREGIAAESARAWLLRTAHRLSIDHLRKRARGGGAHRDHRSTRPASDDGYAALDALASPFPCPARESSLDDETRLQLGSAIAALPPTDRSILLLREAHGLSYDELANVLDRPLGTIKVMLHRARRRVREAMSIEEASR